MKRNSRRAKENFMFPLICDNISFPARPPDLFAGSKPKYQTLKTVDTKMKFDTSLQNHFP